MITPPFLQPGDKIAIVAPARKITPAEVEPALMKIREWGFVPVCGEHLYSTDNQFAGTDAERAADFQQMLDDDNIKAILCARGGYGTHRILDKLDFTGFCALPKWIIGYSDVTVLHSFIHQELSIETIHAAMPVNFPLNGEDNESLLSLHKILTGNSPEYRMPAHPMNRIGESTGLLTGGNLSILYSLRGTPGDVSTEGKLLFIEDIDEYLYHIDRMMINLKMGGKLERLSGLIVGGMSDMRDNAIPFGKTAEEIIAAAVQNYSFPVIFGFPSGHLPENLALVLGRKIHLSVTTANSLLQFYP
jgi:muramoyltetrapeptide carboxypeptidase